MFTPAILVATAFAADLRQVPGPWDHGVATLAGRGDAGADLEMHYLAMGPTDAPRVVLLHGFPDFSYGWRYVMPQLAQDLRVYAPDLRGYAGTDRPRTGYDLATLSGDVLAFLDVVTAAEGRDPAEPVHLVGHDWGASLGWRAVNDAPERFASWTALDVPHLRTLVAYMEVSKEQREYRKFFGQLVLPFAAQFLADVSIERRADLFYRDELVNDAALRPEDLAWYHEVFDERDDVVGPLRYYRQMAFHRGPVTRYYADAPPIAVPTLVLFGSEDNYMLPPMAELSCLQVSARCEHAVVADAGHYLAWDQPDAVVARWRAFTGLQP